MRWKEREYASNTQDWEKIIQNVHLEVGYDSWVNCLSVLSYVIMWLWQGEEICVDNSFGSVQSSQSLHLAVHKCCNMRPITKPSLISFCCQFEAALDLWLSTKPSEIKSVKVGFGKKELSVLLMFTFFFQEVQEAMIFENRYTQYTMEVRIYFL